MADGSECGSDSEKLRVWVMAVTFASGGVVTRSLFVQSVNQATTTRSGGKGFRYPGQGSELEIIFRT